MSCISTAAGDPSGGLRTFQALGASSKEITLTAVLGRLSFVVVFAALLFAAFVRSPRLFASTHVAHFAGFYIFTITCAAAAKRIPLVTLGCFVAAFAVMVELIRAAFWLPITSSYLDWIGDTAGIVACLAPMLLQKIRANFLATLKSKAPLQG